MQEASKLSYTSPRLLPPQLLVAEDISTNISTSLTPQGNLINLTIPRFSEFTAQLQEQVRRFSPAFTIKLSAQPLLIQVIETFKLSIDLFLERYSRLLKPPRKSRNSNSMIEDPSRPPALSVGEDIGKAKETMRNLYKYEQLLKKKEETLKADQNKIFEESENLNVLSENFRLAKANFEAEQNAWILDKEREQERLEAERKKILLEKLELERVAMEIKELKLKIDKIEKEAQNSFKLKEESIKANEKCLHEAKEELLVGKNKLSKDRIDFEQEKWKNYQASKKIEENEIIFKMKYEHYLLERAELEKEKMSIKRLSYQLEAEKKSFLKTKEAQLKERTFSESSERQDFNVVITDENLISSAFIMDKSQELSEREEEIDKAYLELNSQIEIFNNELEQRESNLLLREKTLALQEGSIEQKFSTIKQIESSLKSSKNSLEEFQKTTIPEVDSMSQLLQELISEVNIKKVFLGDLITRLNKEIALVKLVRGGLEVISESQDDYSPVTSPVRGNAKVDDFELRVQSLSNTVNGEMDRHQIKNNSLSEFIQEIEQNLNQKNMMKALSGGGMP